MRSAVSRSSSGRPRGTLRRVAWCRPSTAQRGALGDLQMLELSRQALRVAISLTELRTLLWVESDLAQWQRELRKASPA